MELQGQQTIPASRERTRVAPNGLGVLKGGPPGCESLPFSAANDLQDVLEVRVGPVSARLNDTLRLAGLRLLARCTTHLDASGGTGGIRVLAAVMGSRRAGAAGCRLHRPPPRST